MHRTESRHRTGDSVFHFRFLEHLVGVTPKPQNKSWYRGIFECEIVDAEMSDAMK